MGKVLNPAKTISGRKATVTLNGDTLKTAWNGVEVGKRFKVQRDGERAYYFIADSIEPTAPDSEYAWVKGTRVNSKNAPVIGQISHLHCGEGKREELIHVSMVKAFRQ